MQHDYRLVRDEVEAARRRSLTRYNVRAPRGGRRARRRWRFRSRVGG